MISVVATATVVFLVVGAIFLAFPERRFPYQGLSGSRSDYYDKPPRTVANIAFYFCAFIWPCIQLFIVFIDSVLMIYVYIGVASSYDLKIVSCFMRKESQSHKLQEGKTSKATTGATDLNEYRGKSFEHIDKNELES